MSRTDYDVIVVGARCAGSPTAMLLALEGHQVLVVDSARFPSDTVSTHVVHPLGMAALARWGLRDELVATGCPPIDTYAFDFGPFTIAGAPGTSEAPLAYCPRRTVLDKLLVDAARRAGAEVREAFTVDEILISDGRATGVRGHGQDGESVSLTARLVIGADGRHSRVAQAVKAEQYNERPPLLCGYYAYFSDLPMNGRFETYALDHHGIAAAPTHDDLTLVIAGWPFADFEANKRDLEASFMRVFELAPAFGERVRTAKRQSRIFGTPVANFFRKPYGPGWALVGDAGYNRDPITAQGITDAFRDAELLATATNAWLRGAQPFDAAMASYHETRDAQVLPIYEFTCQLARLEPPPPEMMQLLGAVHGNQDAMDGFCQVNSGATSPLEFFSDANVARIFAAAAAS